MRYTRKRWRHPGPCTPGRGVFQCLRSDAQLLDGQGQVKGIASHSPGHTVPKGSGPPDLLLSPPR